MDSGLILLFILLLYPLSQVMGILEILSAKYVHTWKTVIKEPEEEDRFSILLYEINKKYPLIRKMVDRLPECSLIHRYYMNKGFDCASKYPECDSNVPHDAIVIAHGDYSQKLGYGDGVELIIIKFRNSRIPYRVYDCQNVSAFRDAVMNPLARNIWIFGHGDRGGIRIGFVYLEYKKEFEMYRDLKKAYIYQFHCNSGTKPSLADLLSDGRGYVSNTFRDELQNREHVRQILENIS